MEKEPIVVSATELRKNLPEIVDRVRLLKQEYIITKNNKPFARLRPLTEKELGK